MRTPGVPLRLMDDKDDAKSCVRCGRCMAVCPVYGTTLREYDAPRGRLALLENLGRSGSGSKRLKEILSRCLLCGACGEVCAAGVDTVSVLQAGRSRLFGDRGGPITGDVIARSEWETALSKKVVTKGGTLLQALICRRIPEASGLHLRFPLRFFIKRQTVPGLSEIPFMEEPKARKAAESESARVGLFVGCGANYIFPESARALVHILGRLGLSVAVPAEQECCGLPAYVSGNTPRAQALARKNIETFETAGVDTILTVCASCGAHLQGLPHLFVEGSSWHGRAQAVAEKHRDAMAFLVEQTGLSSLFRASRAEIEKGRPIRRVAYHDPCHLRITQGITDAPRRFLEMLPGVKLMETPHEGRCCGHGGGFNLTHFDVSMDILEKRMADLRQVSPELIVTGCTGCLLQFIEGVSRLGLEGAVRVLHPLVLAQQTLSEERG